VLTDTLDGDGGVIEDGDRGGERPNDQRGVGRGRERLALRAAGSGACGLRRAFVTASLSPLIARDERGRGSRGALMGERGRASDAVVVVLATARVSLQP
jgi:hypothetical protein